MDASTDATVRTTERIFADLGKPPVGPGAASGAWREPLWSALEEAGLPLAWGMASEADSDVPLALGFGILRAAGKHAVPVPLAETLLAGWLLAQAGLEVPAGRIGIAPQRFKDRLLLDADGRLQGKARRIPFAPEVGHFAVLAQRGSGTVAALVEAGRCTIAPAATLAGDAAGDVVFDGAGVVAQAEWPLHPDALQFMGAVARATMMAGALEAVLDLSVAYAKDRIAFGRPIARFQAIQHSLATLGCEAAAASAAASSAIDTLETLGPDGSDAMLLEVAAAKIRSAEAAQAGARIAHQVHGAMGFTKEYALNLYTRRLWSWRDEFGSEMDWSLRLGTMVAARGADQLWPLVASR